MLCRMAWTFSIGVMVLDATAALGQNYPTKPICLLAGEIGER